MTQNTPGSKTPWLSHYQTGVVPGVAYKNTPLPHMLAGAARTIPDHPALIFQGYEMNYRELNDAVDTMAAAFFAFGIRKGDRIALLMPNTIPLVIAHFAALRLGAVTVMNNPLYTDRELVHQFNDSGARLLVTLDILADRMANLLPQTDLRQIVYASIGDYLPLPKKLLFPFVGKKKGLAATVRPNPLVIRWKDALSYAKKGFPDPMLTMEDLAVLQYTGGTTGPSKGAMLSHGNLSYQAQQLAAWFPESPFGEERFLGALPFFHIFGLSVVMQYAISIGAAIILVPRPTTDALLENIERHRPTFAFMVPTMYIGLLQHPDIEQADLTSINGCFSGSAPLPLEVIQEFEARTGAKIVEGFGMTETSPVTHIQPFGGLRKAGSVGIPLPDTRIRLVDPADGKTDVPSGEEGEMLVAGPQVMQGYHGKPEETENVFVDGWLRTGDMARMDSDGYFYIVDRIKDVIKINAISVFPREIDEVLHEHPKIQEACTIGIPHPVQGEVPKAFIVVKSGQTLREEDVVAWCSVRLARFKVPRNIAFTDALPKSAVGKILRRQLREMETGALQNAS